MEGHGQKNFRALRAGSVPPFLVQTGAPTFKFVPAPLARVTTSAPRCRDRMKHYKTVRTIEIKLQQNRNKTVLNGFISAKTKVQPLNVLANHSRYPPFAPKPGPGSGAMTCE